MPMLKQVATFNPPSYAMINGYTIYIDDDIFEEYGNWEVVDSWERYDGFMIYEIDLPINE